MKALQVILRLALPLLIIGGGIFAWDYLKNPEEKEEKVSANHFQKNPSPNEIVKMQKKGEEAEGFPVLVNPLPLTSYSVLVPSRGESVAGEETEIVAETEGKIRHLAPVFEVGSFVKKGDLLVELDQEDLRADVAIAQARVAQAEASLVQEEARAEQALLNWNDIGYEEEPGDLVLRKPQLKQAKATLEGAKAQVDKAERELERALIHAPYDGIIAERVVSTGQKLGRGRPIGKIIGTSHADISLPIAAKDEPFLPTVIKDAHVIFRNPILGENSPTWEGHLTTREPSVDVNTKQLHLRARIQDPYSRENTQGSPLPVGQPVIAEISGVTLEDVYCVPKSALRGADTIHVALPDKTLKVFTISPLWTDKENIIFRAKLPDGCHWVETVMKNGANSMQLKFIDPEEEKESTTSAN